MHALTLNMGILCSTHISVCRTGHNSFGYNAEYTSVWTQVNICSVDQQDEFDKYKKMYRENQK